MRVIFLDCLQMTEKASAHNYIAENLGFPEYYGGNLDALYDCLTSLPECEIYLLNSACLTAQPGIGILSVFKEVSSENKRISLKIYA